MKVKVETVIDLRTGDYEMQFINVSNPGESMDYTLIRDVMKLIFADVEQKVDDPDEELPDGFYDPMN